MPRLREFVAHPIREETAWTHRLELSAIVYVDRIRKQGESEAQPRANLKSNEIQLLIPRNRAAS